MLTGALPKDHHRLYTGMPIGIRQQVRARREAALRAALAGDNMAQTRQPGVTIARQMIVMGTVLWTFAKKTHGLTVPDPWATVTTIKPLGKARLITNDELTHLLETADRMKLNHVGDAFIMAVHTGQRRSDLFNLPRSVASTGQLEIRQSKKGVNIAMRLSPRAMIRAKEIIGRDSHTATTLIADASTGLPFKSLNQINRFDCHRARVRAEAMLTMPSVADITLHDGRDTAVTRLIKAGNSLLTVCAITGHSPKSADVIWTSYVAADAQLANDGIQKLDSMLNENGTRW